MQNPSPKAERAGGSECYEEIARLWTRAQPAVAAYLASMVYDCHDAEDLLQRTAMVVIRRFEDYDPARPFTPWAVGIAHIEVLRYRRESARDRLVFSEAAMDAIAHAYSTLEPGISAESRDALGRCVQRLRGRGRQVVELFYGDGCKLDTIASRLSISRGTVGATLSRTRDALRECVAVELRRRRAGRG